MFEKINKKMLKNLVLNSELSIILQGEQSNHKTTMLLDIYGELIIEEPFIN